MIKIIIVGILVLVVANIIICIGEYYAKKIDEEDYKLSKKK